MSDVLSPDQHWQHFNASVAAKVESLRDKIKKVEALPHQVYDITQRMLQTGVLRFSNKEAAEYLTHGIAIRQYCKEIAKLKGRPCIVVHDGGKYDNSLSTMTLPNLKKMENLAAGLVIIAEKVLPQPDWVYAHNHRDALLQIDQGGWHFVFTGEKRALIDQQIEAWLADPVYRIIMKLNGNPKR